MLYKLIKITFKYFAKQYANNSNNAIYCVTFFKDESMEEMGCNSNGVIMMTFNLNAVTTNCNKYGCGCGLNRNYNNLLMKSRYYRSIFANCT